LNETGEKTKNKQRRTVNFAFKVTWIAIQNEQRRYPKDREVNREDRRVADRDESAATKPDQTIAEKKAVQTELS